MYRCPHCGDEFDRPKIVKVYERHTELPGNPAEVLEEEHCPHCGDDMIEESEPCVVCGVHFPDYGDVCSGCLDKANTIAEQMMADMKAERRDMATLWGEWAERNW